MRINSKADAYQTLRALNEAKSKMKASMERLSSGKKINRASDDPAGLVISEKMRVQISSLEKELDNLENRNNKLSTADGHLQTLQNNLRSMRIIALSAANEGANSEDEQAVYQESLQRATEAYNQTQENASYGSQKLFDGSEGAVANLEKMPQLDVSSSEKAQEAVAAIDRKFEDISRLRSEIGATQKYEIDSRRNNIETEIINLTASESSVRDTDMAREYVDFIKSEVQLKADLAILAHQNQVPNLVLNFLQR